MPRLAAAVLAMLASVTTVAAAGTAFHFDGTWRIARVVGYSDVSVSPEQIQRLVGQNITISAHQIAIGSDDCKPDAMHLRTRATTALLRDEYRAGPSDAGVAARTQVLDTGRCGHVFRAGSDIVVYQGGAFYRAVREPVTGK